MNTKQILKRKSELSITNWSGGSTTELLIYPATSMYSKRDFDVRISSATIKESPSNFTFLPGYKRLLMPISAPLSLSFDGGSSKVVNPFESVRFDGETGTVSTGICTDIGIMFKQEYTCSIVCAFDCRKEERGESTNSLAYSVSEYLNANLNKYNISDFFTCVYSLYDGITATCDKQSHVLNASDFLIIKNDANNQDNCDRFTVSINHLALDLANHPYAIILYFQKSL